jgi:hypothetical protein
MNIAPPVYPLILILVRSMCFRDVKHDTHSKQDGDTDISRGECAAQQEHVPDRRGSDAIFASSSRRIHLAQGPGNGSQATSMQFIESTSHRTEERRDIADFSPRKPARRANVAGESPSPRNHTRAASPPHAAQCAHSTTAHRTNTSPPAATVFASAIDAADRAIASNASHSLRSSDIFMCERWM